MRLENTFGKINFFQNTGGSYLIDSEVDEKSDIVIAYRLNDYTNYNFVLNDADYTIVSDFGSTIIEIVNSELLQKIESLKVITKLKQIDTLNQSELILELSERVRLLENMLSKNYVSIDDLEPTTTLPALKNNDLWIGKENGTETITIDDFRNVAGETLETWVEFEKDLIKEISKIAFDRIQEYGNTLKLSLDKILEESIFESKAELLATIDIILEFIYGIKTNIFLNSPDGTKFAIGIQDDGFLYSMVFEGAEEYKDYYEMVSIGGKKFNLKINDAGMIITEEVV